MRLSRLGISLIAAGTLLVAVPALAEVTDFTPVTDADILNPAPEDWLQWRAGVDSWGYSPLSEITADNVGELEYVWGWAMEPGEQETAPIVRDGIMYVANPGGIVQALNAATGDLIWEYRRQMPEGFRAGRLTRGISIYGDKIYFPSPDAVLVAINARTGQVEWESVVADHADRKSLTAAPLIADGKVIVGFQGCNRFSEEKCAVVAYDAESGEEMWRTITIERPGETENDTWEDIPFVLRGGGDIWTTASYDADANLVYIGVSQAKPWSRVSRANDGDGLYTTSTLALDPSTGEIQWHRQYIPGETNDMDESFEHILVDIDGEPAYVNMGKLGILWRGNRETGESLPAFDIGLQDQIDLNADGTFAAYREGKIGEVGVPMTTCPSSTGFRSWRAMAFSPETRAVYVPLSINCDDGVIYTEVEMVEGGGGNGRSATNRIFHPDDPDNLGRVLAMDVDTGETLWEFPMRTPANTATLTTAGGVVFAGDWDRNFYAFDAANGDVLWNTRLPQAAQGYPISYEADGRQYVAVPVGVGGASWSTSVPQDLAPEVKRPSSGNAMMVFAVKQN
ncbi:MAG TPA: PQQ-binding-like beta-propeller repeat protein [Pelagibacterium sp.]|uniref:pyrroloquinoline quinone-dependent dehydrogenase n=1 Tax=Pelagibacterium sp. TaxID=1967288 RepID=UPI002BD49CE8|nr:PQQ-binding-like beta-propeller repeat protein [Pelagibacterium sp.]HWJ89032.1 PQQ-binding-like beta-propeller repeat protein [Pelagibacterium sp.]